MSRYAFVLVLLAVLAVAASGVPATRTAPGGGPCSIRAGGIVCGVG